MSQEFERFGAYLKVADMLIEQASKEDLAETARVLALHLAYYQTKYDAIPVQESLKLMLTETIDDSQAGALADGFEVLIEVIRAVSSAKIDAHSCRFPTGDSRDGTCRDRVSATRVGFNAAPSGRHGSA